MILRHKRPTPYELHERGFADPSAMLGTAARLNWPTPSTSNPNVAKSPNDALNRAKQRTFTRKT